MRARSTFRAAALTLATTAALSACADGPTSAPNLRTLPEPDLRQMIVDLRFRGDMIEDMGNYYLVEGDISLSKAALAARAGSGPRYQYTSTNLVTPINVAQIRVDLSALTPYPEWLSAAREAITHWNTVSGSYVNISEGAPTHITFFTDCNYQSWLGQGSFPLNGAPGNSVTVNRCWRMNGIDQTPSHLARVRTVAHELGHTVGFRHTNWNTADCGVPCNGYTGPEGAVHVPGTPQLEGDPNSMFNGNEAGRAWAGFSAYDLSAIRNRYPLPKAIVNVSNSGGQALVQWGALYGATSYTLKLVHKVTIDSKTEGSWSDEDIRVVGTTTGTSLLDSQSTYSGVSTCYVNEPDHTIRKEFWRYEITSTFPKGSTRVLAEAPVGAC